MTRTVQICVCAVLVGVVWGPAVAEENDSWTSSLGQFTRALAEQRRDEAAMAKEFPTSHIAFDPTLEDPYYVVADYHRMPHVYLDRRRFFLNQGNLKIDYRSLASLPDQRIFPWTPFDTTKFSSRGRDFGGRGRGDGYGGYGRGGTYSDYGQTFSGVRQIVPLEFLNNRGGVGAARRGLRRGIRRGISRGGFTRGRSRSGRAYGGYPR